MNNTARLLNQIPGLIGGEDGLLVKRGIWEKKGVIINKLPFIVSALL
jgi:hypothetical protein